ncbi:hypothetical protein [Litchfieldia alkalitelluris]|uniref:hypothetical protein n=1 Tax=Litchfieldia alkalitelluris TaxID=304268 RepID=UPI00099758C4|nr:hypothetical protein [Litchfieldia alkalitelluris]
MKFPSKGLMQRCPYYYHYPSYYHGNPFYIQNVRQYPEINTETFVNSAKTTKKLVQESELICNQITTSEAFAKELMGAAQVSDDRKVKELLKTTGISSTVNTNYTPDGINIILSRSLNDIECCRLNLALRWR